MKKFKNGSYEKKIKLDNKQEDCVIIEDDDEILPPKRKSSGKKIPKSAQSDVKKINVVCAYCKLVSDKCLMFNLKIIYKISEVHIWSHQNTLQKNSLEATQLDTSANF